MGKLFRRILPRILKILERVPKIFKEGYLFEVLILIFVHGKLEELMAKCFKPKSSKICYVEKFVTLNFSGRLGFRNLHKLR